MKNTEISNIKFHNVSAAQCCYCAYPIPVAT